jgi:hypothetical protein
MPEASPIAERADIPLVANDLLARQYRHRPPCMFRFILADGGLPNGLGKMEDDRTLAATAQLCDRTELGGPSHNIQKLRHLRGHVCEFKVHLRRESDQTYRAARFRKAGVHSAKEKTDVGPRAYYRDRIISVARGIV